MKRNILIVLCVMFIIGCTSKGSEIDLIYNQMTSKPVSIPFSQMSCWINDTIQQKRPWECAKMKLIVYTDSTSCSDCTLKRMYLWNDFVKLEKKYDGKFSVFFIFQTESSVDVTKFASKFYLTELTHPIYVDFENAFATENPHIPCDNHLAQVFLLDAKNNVVLVGNPLFNTVVEDSLLNIVDRNLKTVDDNTGLCL